MDGPPTDGHEGFPEAVPGPGARDTRKGSGAASLPCPPEAGTWGRVRHDGSGGSPFLAVHARASARVAHARGWWLVHGGGARTRAAPGEVTAGCATTPCGLAGAVAGLPPNDQRARWQPAPHARQEEPGQRRRRFLACPRCLMPRWGARPGDHHRECPRPNRERKRDQPGPHDPLRPPPRRRIAVGGAPASAMAARANDCGARAFRNRLIPRQEHRPLRPYGGAQPRHHHARQVPGGPAARRQHPMRRSGRALGVRAHGP
jgi:hypothetical protein